MSAGEAGVGDQGWEEIRRYIARALLRVFIPCMVFVALTVGILSSIPTLYPERLAVAVATGLGAIVPWIYRRRNKNLRGLAWALSSILLITVGGVLFTGGLFEPAYVAMLALLAMGAWFVSNRAIAAYVVAFFTLGLITTQLMEAGVIAPKPLPDGRWYTGVLTTLAVTIGFTLATVRTLLRGALYQTKKTSLILESVFAAIDDTVILLDEDLNIVSVEDAAPASVPVFHGAPWHELLEFPTLVRGEMVQSVRDTLTRFTAKDGPQRVVVRIAPAEDDIRFFEITAASVAPTLAVQSTGLAVLVRDITEDMRQREHWSQFQKMEAIGQLASGIAHDFNNILTGIRSSAEVLAEDASSEQTELLELIIDSSERAGLLTRRLLAHGARATPEPEVIEVTQRIRETIGLLQKTLDRGVDISLESPARELAVRMDETLLQGTFLNLALNAAQAMPNGGHITFRTDTKTVDAEFAQGIRGSPEPGEYALIEVKDTGEGIPLELQDKIFEPFFTTKTRGEGTGLGLATSYQSLRAAGGGITVESRPGHGALFSIFIPLHTEAFDPPRSPPPVAPANPRLSEAHPNARVMVIDDEAAVRKSLHLALSGRAYDVESCDNGAEALARLAETSFDVVVLDMLMPIMSGRDTFYAIQELPNPPSVLVTTGYAEDEQLRQMLDDGLFGVVYKPYAIDTIVAELERAQSERSGGRPETPRQPSAVSPAATASASHDAARSDN